MDILSIILFLFIGGGVLALVLSLLWGAGIWLAQLFYATYHALFVKEDKAKGKNIDYGIEQGKEIK
jgi:hypothetical protein